MSRSWELGLDKIKNIVPFRKIRSFSYWYRLSRHYGSLTAQYRTVAPCWVIMWSADTHGCVMLQGIIYRCTFLVILVILWVCESDCFLYIVSVWVCVMYIVSVWVWLLHVYCKCVSLTASCILWVCECVSLAAPCIFWVCSSSSSSSSSSSGTRRTYRWVHFQQNAGLWLFVHTWIVHCIDDRYQFTRTFGGFSAQCLSKLFLKEFTALLVTTSFGMAFHVVVILIG